MVSGQAGDDDRVRLVGDLVGSLFKSFADLANTESGGYLEFDEGLRVMTRHAKALGYDAVVLFLDELILWLASRLSDRNFINSEIQKVVKLVETGIPRELPLISFIARQRDLREFVGDQYSGVEQEILSDSLKYWEGRFHTITLEDRNLPVIAQRRLLQPLSASAQAQIEESFAQTERMREEAFNLLLTSKGDREMFRALYPFSPALVQALVALSSALQRERTALKVMLMLLVEQRETLALGSVIPVGDLYDVIASEAEPFSEQMRQHFDNAKLLFERKLIPVLEQEHQIAGQALQELPPNDAKRQAFNNDLRLLKTLVLAALVPEVESFKQLTATKLAALNHGTIRSPIPGQEARTVLQKCRKWAGQVGEIKISDDPNPTIGVQLSGVDTESIIEQARINDNDGNRRRLVKEMVFDAFGIRDDNQLFVEHEWLWRGTRRRVEVLFQNVREITDDSLFESRDDQWKVIIDFPFDTGNYSPTDDQARVRDFEAAGGQARTICWLPYFLSQSAQKNLGKLVVLEDILKSEDSFNRYSRHLSPQDRVSARTLLDNQRSQLRQQMKDVLIGAYGVAQALPGSLDHSDLLESQLMSLQPGFTPRPPQGTTMAKAFEQLLGQALTAQYPDHPEFDGEVRPADLGKVFTELCRAIHAPHGRIDVEGPLRPLMRQIAQPLTLGEMHERHFIFKENWPQQLSRALAQRSGWWGRDRAGAARGDGPATPAGLADGRAEFAGPGLRRAWTVRLHLPRRSVRRCHLEGHPRRPGADQAGSGGAGAVEAGLGSRQRRLWSDDQSAAHGEQPERAAEGSARRGRYLSGALSCAAGRSDRPARCLGSFSERPSTRQCQPRRHSCWKHLQTQEGPALVDALAGITPVTSLQALARSIVAATRVSHAIADNNWALLETVWGGGEGARIKRAVADALAADELVTSLADALKQAQADATRLIQRPPVIDPPIKPPPKPPVRPKGKTVLKQDNRQGLAVGEARRVLKEIEPLLRDGVTLDISYQILGETDG